MPQTRMPTVLASIVRIPKAVSMFPLPEICQVCSFAEYILKERTATGTMPQDPALVETIVTTDMAKVIAEAYGVKLIEVLTGFKYIGEQIRLFEENHTYNYVFGLEELMVVWQEPMPEIKMPVWQ